MKSKLMNENIERIVFKNKSKSELIKEAFQNFEKLVSRIYTDFEDEEMINLRTEIEVKKEDVGCFHKSTILYFDSHLFSSYSVEVKLGINIKNVGIEKEIGYYALVWDRDGNLIEEFFVLN